MENKAIKFNIKEASIQEFADKYILRDVKDMRGPNSRHDAINPYYALSQTSFFVRKELLDIIGSDSVIQFELSDESVNSKTKLTNTYLFEIDEHDAISLKLTLVNFKVSLAENIA